MSRGRCRVGMGAQTLKCCRADGHDGWCCPHGVRHVMVSDPPGALRTWVDKLYRCSEYPQG